MGYTLKKTHDKFMDFVMEFLRSIRGRARTFILVKPIDRVCVPSVISRSQFHPIRKQAITAPIDSVLFVFMRAQF